MACGKATFTITLSIIATKKWELKSIDIKTAFLQGSKLARDIYLKPPVEANCGINFAKELR